MTRRIGALPLLFAVVLAAPQAEQPADAPQIEPIDIGFTEETGRSLLFLDVEAVDAAGRPLFGLSKQDFQIRVNYVWRKIYSVDDLCPCGDGATTEEGDPVAEARRAIVRMPPHFVLYFDFSQLQSTGRAQAIEEARRWAGEVMQPDDRVMVVAYASEARLRVLTDFTSDRDQVLRAIEAGAAAPDLLDPFPSEYRDRQALCDDGTLSCYHVGRQEYFHARRSLETLRNFLTELDGVPARKTLLLFHENATIFPGRSYADGPGDLPESTWDRLEALREPGSARARQLRGASALVPDLLELSQDVGGSATASRTVVYPLACGSARSLTFNLGANLADQTGGEHNRLTREVGELLARAGRGCPCIYRIGLEMEERSKSFVLRTKVRARGLTLPSRYHVQHLTDADRWMRKAQLVLANPEAWRELEVGAALVPVAARGKRWDARVEIGLDLAALQVALGEDDRQTAEWEVGALLSDGEGRRQWEMLGIYRASPDARGRIESIVLHERPLGGLDPGHYELRAFVHDRGADRYGAALGEIDLPPTDRPGLAGPLAQRPATAHLLEPLPLRGRSPGKADELGRPAAGPLPLGDDPLVARGQVVQFLTFVCGPGATEIRSAVRREAAAEPYEGKSETVVVGESGGCVPLVQAIESLGLEPGRYSYEIEADRTAAGGRATFEIGPARPEPH